MGITSFELVLTHRLQHISRALERQIVTQFRHVPVVVDLREHNTRAARLEQHWLIHVAHLKIRSLLKSVASMKCTYKFKQILFKKER